MEIPQYEPPQVETYSDEDIVKALGPIETVVTIPDSCIVNGQVICLS